MKKLSAAAVAVAVFLNVTPVFAHVRDRAPEPRKPSIVKVIKRLLGITSNDHQVTIPRP